MTLFTARIVAFTTRWGAACDWDCTETERERERGGGRGSNAFVCLI